VLGGFTKVRKEFADVHSVPAKYILVCLKDALTTVFEKSNNNYYPFGIISPKCKKLPSIDLI
jgi:hypothetical protein